MVYEHVLRELGEAVDFDVDVLNVHLCVLGLPALDRVAGTPVGLGLVG